MRTFFAKRFNIRKKFTYIELTEVARRRKVEIGLADMIAKLAMKMTEIEYKHIEPTISDLNLAIKNAVVIVERLTKMRMQEALEKRSEEEIKRVEPKRERVELPKAVPEKRAKKYKMTEKDSANVKRLEGLLDTGERSLANHKLAEAEKAYSEIRKIYDGLHPEVKKSLYLQTVRIIKLYNQIMKQLK